MCNIMFGGTCLSMQISFGMHILLGHLPYMAVREVGNCNCPEYYNYNNNNIITINLVEEASHVPTKLNTVEYFL